MRGTLEVIAHDTTNDNEDGISASSNQPQRLVYDFLASAFHFIILGTNLDSCNQLYKEEIFLSMTVFV